jgi:hypothetical protein
MQKIKLRSHVGSDGMLHLDIPVETKDNELEVIVIVEPVKTKISTPEDLEWSPGFFERTAGAWEGEPLVRGEQGDYPQREELL